VFASTNKKADSATVESALNPRIKNSNYESLIKQNPILIRLDIILKSSHLDPLRQTNPLRK